MIEEKTIIAAADGTAETYIFYPEEKGRWPAVLFYMDAMGLRPALQDMARRLAGFGYFVMLPDLYYREMPHQTFDGADVLQPGPKRDEIFRLYQSLQLSNVMADTEKFFDYFAKSEHVAGDKFGCLGYCMGGKCAMAAFGTFGSRVAASAVIHAAGLATDSADSPHRRLSEGKGRVYVGVAEIDEHFPPDERTRVQDALKASGANHEYEDYPGVRHGFAVNDVPVYDKQAAEHHWQRVRELFDSMLRQPVK